MATASPSIITVPAGTARVYMGRAAAPAFTSVTETRAGSTAAPTSDLAQTLVLNLHGSGNDLVGLTTTRVLLAELAAAYSYSTDTTFLWHEANAGLINGNRAMNVWPWDRQPPLGTNRRESNWSGWTVTEDGRWHLYTERRLLALLQRYASDPRISATKRALTGGSMGGWGTASFGVHHPELWPAIWPDRPRWRYAQTTGLVEVPAWDTVAPKPQYASASAPLLAAADGGYSAATYLDLVAWVANTANQVPWIGWVIGKQDGFMPWQDHVDMIDAMTASGRGFAVSWNNGVHGGGPNPQTITGSYPFGLFELGKGYPVFSEHSLNADPVTDLVGGINVGLSFRSVVETSGTWSCQVTHISSACTVKVKPKSPIFLGNPAPQLVNIPAANTWVTVSF